MHICRSPISKYLFDNAIPFRILYTSRYSRCSSHILMNLTNDAHAQTSTDSVNSSETTFVWKRMKIRCEIQKNCLRLMSAESRCMWLTVPIVTATVTTQSDYTISIKIFNAMNHKMLIESHRQRVGLRLSHIHICLLHLLRMNTCGRM